MSKFYFRDTVNQALKLLNTPTSLSQPLEVTDFKPILFLANRGVIGLVQVKWASGIKGTGLNLVHIAPTELARKIISSFNNWLNYLKPLALTMPQLRHYAFGKDITPLLFSYPKDHPSQNTVFRAKSFASCLQEKPPFLAAIQDEIDKLLKSFDLWHLNNWHNPTTASYDDFFKDISISYDAPIPYASKITFDLDGVPPLPSPIWFVKELISKQNNTVTTFIDFIHGSLTSDRVFTTTPPVVFDWSFAQEKMPIWIDLARLELDILLHLLPPTNDSIWNYEWASLVAALRRIPVDAKSSKGRFAPSALEIISPIRQMIYEKK